MALELGEPRRLPGQCQDEAETVATGSKVMSYCRPWKAWTNCREVGSCTYERWGSE